ncbi:RNHCP domain-containing protein [Patescibacteria group bacterium]|nr:RNHCP domain-containing protein [Patescibacteria group bacterium]
MDEKKFQKRIENFTCENCGTKIKGDGYTNHCSNCLWSKHVDINPGDRKETCKGLMKPIGINLKEGEYILIHRCLKCGKEMKNKISKKDNFDLITKLSQKPHLEQSDTIRKHV